MIAMALSCNPKLLIADEPTTALDVTIQAQILDLMRTLQDETQTAIVLITHDLGVVAQMAHRVAPADVAKQFAVERLRSSRPVGLHKAYNYQSHAALEEMLAGLEEAYASRLAGAAV
jgi:ABC-type dipeptide/oligopeptide/nickel transport system ATPase subunit